MINLVAEVGFDTAANGPYKAWRDLLSLTLGDDRFPPTPHPSFVCHRLGGRDLGDHALSLAVEGLEGGVDLLLIVRLAHVLHLEDADPTRSENRLEAQE